MTFSKKMIKFRATNNLSQQEAADILGVHVNNILRYEKNRGNPTAKNELRFLKIMNMYENDLIGEKK